MTLMRAASAVGGGSAVLEREFSGVLRAVLPAARAAADIRRCALHSTAVASEFVLAGFWLQGLTGGNC